MRPLKQDLSVYQKFNFEKQPVGVKFLPTRPEGIEQLDKSLSYCEMLKEAQDRGTPFYFAKENETCFGKALLGMEELPAFAEAGEVGINLEIFQDARANSNLYQYLKLMPKGIVNYVAYATLDKLAFEPDLLIILANTTQAEIILRAMCYSTGVLRESVSTGVLGCAWVYNYPYRTGKVNYTVTGLAFGMKSKEVYKEGYILISIPYNWIPTITQNLQEMKWVLPSYTEGREKFLIRERENIEELARKMENP
ncbi:MAG: DUF169 domain-containing protein [Dehalococcoidales bacterium]|nr:DUF169 domain-containing protein [Dehalococcoidales bacterium]